MYSKYSLMNIISNSNIKNGKVDKIDNTDLDNTAFISTCLSI